jgi:Ca-activated chloride channel family protein
MLEFAYPWAFALALLPIVVFWFAPIYKEKKHSMQVPYFSRLVAVTGERPQSGAVMINRKNIQRLLVFIGWLCLVTAMAKPEIVGQPIVQKKSARDLMVAVDLSGSMSVEDFIAVNGNKINRLIAVKQVLSDFAKGREGDRLGLILFGDAPYLQAPFTGDLTTWLTLLNEADIGMAGQSTAFGDAIGLSINVFENTEAKNRVLIVLTDGNDTSSKVPPVDAAKVAAAYNIKIYTIAIGDPEAVGEEQVDLAVLKEIAQVSNGKNFQALNREELRNVYQEINSLEPELFESRSFRPRTSAHHYPLILFISMYLIALMISAIKIRLNRSKGELV